MSTADTPPWINPVRKTPQAAPATTNNSTLLLPSLSAIIPYKLAVKRKPIQKLTLIAVESQALSHTRDSSVTALNEGNTQDHSRFVFVGWCEFGQGGDVLALSSSACSDNLSIWPSTGRLELGSASSPGLNLQLPRAVIYTARSVGGAATSHAQETTTYGTNCPPPNCPT